ncbi:MAG: glycoside hydrolase family 2 [Bacteroidetes bacterium]|nr:MAG: glycoside hydrolase family 2 [Bacteroidota bacterium]
MTNVLGRKLTSLNGKWQVIIDPNDAGEGVGIGKDAKAKGKTDFLEYSFDETTTLNVPGDFNSQMPELTYYESSVWYKKTFTYHKTDKRLFLHFGAANYIADVYFNGEKIGSHEGGFTPFQFEITDKVKEENSIVVRVNNQRHKDGIPAMGYDWFNYGGLTRDVNLIETPATYIVDYFVQLKKASLNQIEGWIKLSGNKAKQQVRLLIPEAKINYVITTNDTGYAHYELKAKLALWSPWQPKLYSVQIKAETDSINEAIGFRTIESKATAILLNGKSIFLKGVNIHEEISIEKRKAINEKDALQLLTAAKELGCNFVRLTHYPHNEYMVRLADKMGILLWEEIPMWQNIAFGEPGMQSRMENMMKEMIQRDQNRSSIIIWSMSNETRPTPARTASLISLASVVRQKDSTRLIASALNHINFNKNVVTIDDSLCSVLDVVGVNAYLGWYRQWLAEPKDYVWQSPFNKPLIMTEFGAEALYGHHGSADTASNWTEEYQEHVYKDNIVMLKNIPFLSGTTPWILYDFRSERRMNGTYQKGWNRKGLLSDKGEKKKAWYVMKTFYDSIP